MKDVPFHIRNHKEQGVVEIVFPLKPRLTLCLTASMSLGEAAEKIIKRYKTEK